MNTEKPATPFTPFQAPLPPMFEGTVVAAQAAQPAPAPAPKRKRSSNKKKAMPKAMHPPGTIHSPKKPAPKAEAVLRAKRKKPAADRHAVDAAKPARKTRGAPKGKRAPKFELQMIMKIASTLKEADQKIFERFLGELSAMPKAMRRRVLIALGQVFG